MKVGRHKSAQIYILVPITEQFTKCALNKWINKPSNVFWWSEVSAKDIRRGQRLCQHRKLCYVPRAAVVVANSNIEIFKMDGIKCHVINI